MQKAFPLALFFLIAAYTLSCIEFDSGEKIAKRSCGSCHVAPDPSMLDKKTWEGHILPRMGAWLGWGNREILEQDILGENTFGSQNLIKLLPTQPTISKADWKKIQDYYISNAPDTLVAETFPKTYGSLGERFDFEKVLLKNKSRPALNTLLHYDTAKRQLYSGNRDGSFDIYNKTFEKIDSLRFESAPSSMLVDANRGGFELLLTGEIQPNNDPKGSLNLVKGGDVSELISGLFRPVAVEKVDLNADGRLDYVICNYGFHIGKLSWFELLESGKYKEHILLPIPGAIQLKIDDFNKDGRPDIIALMSQGDESVFAFENLGKGQFKPDKWVELPPVYGTSAFEWVDFDKDGFNDLVIVCGDNADYSVIPKPYHGIRFFKNDGKNHFAEAKFIPMKGTTGLQTADFDLDGDMDLAVIANYAEFSDSPQRGFALYENKGSFNFAPLLSAETDCGRWLVIEKADIDDDGDMDLILGSHMMPLVVTSTEMRKWFEQHVNFLVLKNKTKP